jgi:tetratricopeptide (TPR) repeat protein
LELSRRIHDARGEGESYRGLGACYQAKGNWSRAISFFEKGLEIFKRMNDLPALEQTYSNLSLCYSKIGDLERAAFYSEWEDRVKDRILRLRARA